VGSIGGLIRTSAFLSFNSPDFRIGSGRNLGGQIGFNLIDVGLFCCVRWDNTKRDLRNVEHGLAGLSTGQIQDLDWLRLSSDGGCECTEAVQRNYRELLRAQAVVEHAAPPTLYVRKGECGIPLPHCHGERRSYAS
jgi:hypothetical protein